ncbi:MAG: META domain-containing protein [Thiothrix sp.]|nr:META domain-containing protein [Thiothrix sp.]HPQ97300.1 META domain-containing protein [Thiolinea sp.]
MFRKIITSLTGQLFIALLGLGIVSACSIGSGDTQNHKSQLKNTQWIIKSLGGKPVPTTHLPTISFTSDRVAGFNGCNRFSGYYRAGNDAALNLGSLVSSRVACSSPADELEQQVNEKLAQSQMYAITRNDLVLMNGERKVLMTFAQARP